MKTRDAPPSSKGKGKAEESEPSGKTPMARFNATAKSVLGVSPHEIRREEAKAKKKRS